MSGDKNEEQVLNAIEAYTEHRPEITSRAINLLFDIARIERCTQLLRALKVRPDPPGGTGAEWAAGLGTPECACDCRVLSRAPGAQVVLPS